MNASDSSEPSDGLALTILRIVSETASHQITREIAHLAEIAVDTQDDGTHVAPDGLRMPDSGAITIHVVATSRDHAGVSEDMRVAVWPTVDGGHDPAFVVTRSDSDRTLPIALADIHPEPTAHLQGQINDFVAAIIAQMVTELNVKMQRTYIRESQGDLAEYTED